MTTIGSSTNKARTVGRVVLGAGLVFAGTSHLSFARKPFQAQVPKTVTKVAPMNSDQVVLASGVVEIGLGATIALAPERHRELIGNVAAIFFTAIFPGNLAQWQHHRASLGLDSNRKRVIRLLGQPVLVALALWSTRVRQGD